MSKSPRRRPLGSPASQSQSSTKTMVQEIDDYLLAYQSENASVPQTPTQAHTAKNGVNDLVQEIDAYLAHQLQNEPSRRSSRGTMFVDFNEHGKMEVNYRNRPNVDNVQPREEPELLPKRLQPSRQQTTQREAQRLAATKARHTSTSTASRSGQTSRSDRSSTYSPLICTDGDLNVRFQPPTSLYVPGLFVEGADARTGFTYDYDGTIFHLHRDASRPSSCCSDYYEIDASRYAPQTAVLVFDKEAPPLPSERKRREKVARFAQQVLRRLERCGVMARLKVSSRRRKSTGGRGSSKGTPSVTPPPPPPSPHVPMMLQRWIAGD